MLYEPCGDFVAARSFFYCQLFGDCLRASSLDQQNAGVEVPDWNRPATIGSCGSPSLLDKRDWVLRPGPIVRDFLGIGADYLSDASDPQYGWRCLQSCISRK